MLNDVDVFGVVSEMLHNLGLEVLKALAPRPRHVVLVAQESETPQIIGVLLYGRMTTDQLLLHVHNLELVRVQRALIE